MTGRPPKPTALKKLAGNPGKRALNQHEARIAPAMMRAPRHLDTEAKREWRRVVKELYQVGLLTQVDRAALSAYCQAWSRWVKAERDLEGKPLTMETDKGYCYPNPLLGIANSALEQMRKWMTEFGMTPSSRSRVKAEEPKEKSMAEMLFEMTEGKQ